MNQILNDDSYYLNRNYMVASFLLLLFNHFELYSGCEFICSKIISEIDFNHQDYQKGIHQKKYENSKECFWECFYKWKQYIKIDDNQKKQYLQIIKEEIIEYADQIVRNKHRKEYYECAGYIAALGEVEESLGLNSKQEKMLEFKEKYPRHIAFHSELRKYGMND